MIELKQLKKVTGDRAALEVEELVVGAGEIAGVAGPSDGGRAELLALLTGSARPTAGTVSVVGRDPAREREAASRLVGILLAENALYDRLTARENLRFHGRLRGLPPARVDEVLAQVGLAEQAGTPAGRLSPGAARRLAFGRALLHRPPVLLLVEPFGRCDSASTALLTDVIRAWTEEAGGGADSAVPEDRGPGAVLILASEPSGLMPLCQRLYTLEQGRLTRMEAPARETRAELPFKIPARLEDKVALINPSDILYVSADEGRACLHTAEGRIPTHFTLTELEARLGRSGFFRAHRGYLVNLQRVKAVIPYTRDSFDLVLDDATGTEIPLSKTAARELRELLGY